MMIFLLIGYANVRENIKGTFQLLKSFKNIFVINYTNVSENIKQTLQLLKCFFFFGYAKDRENIKWMFYF